MTMKDGVGVGPDVPQLCRLLGDLGHEVATPLASILLTSEMLADNPQGNLSERQVRSLQNLIQAADEVQRLMKRVVLLTRLATGALEFERDLFPLEEMVQEVAGAHESVRLEVASPLTASFESDRMRLFELVELMLEFALSIDPKPELRVASSGGKLSFTVRSVGTLSEEQKTRALDPFGNGLKNARHAGGPGLELPIIARLAAALGGRFEVSDHHDGRIVLEVSFPLAG